MSYRLQVPHSIYQGMLEQAQAELPNECCGILAGVWETHGPEKVGVVLRRYPLVNEAASPREFRSEPKSLFAALKDRRANGWEELAIYHSHPVSLPIPSRTDLKQNFYPEVMSLIISLKEREPCVQAWWLSSDSFRPAEYRIIE